MKTTILSLTKRQVSNTVLKQALLTALLFFLTASATRIHAQNLLQCPGFECTDYNTVWTSEVSAAAAQISTDAYSGSKSIQITNSSSGSYYVLRQNGNLQSDITYTLSGYFKKISGNPIIYFYVEYSGGSHYIDDIQLTSDNWEIKSTNFTLPASSDARVMIGITQHGALLIDDLSLSTKNTIIGFNEIVKVLGDIDFELTATASSGLPVSYEIADPSIATINGSTVHILKAGKTTITATQGNADPVTVNFIVKEDGNRGAYYRVEDFSTAADGWYSSIYYGLYPLEITTDFPMDWQTIWNRSFAQVKWVSSEDSDADFLKNNKNSLLVLPVVNSPATQASADLQTSTLTQNLSGAKKIILYSAGSKSVAADFEALDQPANGYKDITFDAFSNHTYQLEVSDYNRNTKVLSPVYDDQGVWHKWEIDLNFIPAHFNIISSIRGTGTYINNSGNAAGSVSFGMPVIIGAIVADYGDTPASTSYLRNLIPQSINGLSDISTGSGSVTLNATATSGEEVIYFLDDDSGIATLVDGNTVKGLQGGEVTLTAIQAGTAEYASVIKTVKVTVGGTATQTIQDFTDISKAVGDADFELTASATSGLPVTYEIIEGNGTVAELLPDGKTVKIIGAGTAKITASQEGNDGFQAAPDVTVALTVTLTDYSWLQAPAIAIQGNTAKVVGPEDDVDKFTKFSINGGADIEGNSVDLSDVTTDEISLKATSTDGGVIRLKVKKN